MKTVRQFARTVGLYADHIILSDELTSKLLTISKFSDEQVWRFAIDVNVLHELAPLLKAGLISFRSLVAHYCDEHLHAFTSAIDTVASEIVDELNLSPKSRLSGDTFFIHLDELFGYPILEAMELSDKQRKSLKTKAGRRRLLRKMVLEDAKHLVRDTVLAMRDAGAAGGTVLSGSRVSMLALRRLEGSETVESQRWEALRSAALPWVTDLSVRQILALREAAPDALGRLRETLAGMVRQGDPSDLSEPITKLRQEAAEVRAELNVLYKKSDRRFRNVAGVLGLTIAVYGFASGFVPAAPALASLMTLFGLLHGSEHNEQKEVAKLTSKPGYVLVKAQQLLDHAH